MIEFITLSVCFALSLVLIGFLVLHVVRSSSRDKRDLMQMMERTAERKMVFPEQVPFIINRHAEERENRVRHEEPLPRGEDIPSPEDDGTAGFFAGLHQ